MSENNRKEYCKSEVSMNIHVVTMLIHLGSLSYTEASTLSGPTMTCSKDAKHLKKYLQEFLVSSSTCKEFRSHQSILTIHSNNKQQPRQPENLTTLLESVTERKTQSKPSPPILD